MESKDFSAPLEELPAPDACDVQEQSLESVEDRGSLWDGALTVVFHVMDMSEGLDV